LKRQGSLRDPERLDLLIQRGEELGIMMMETAVMSTARSIQPLFRKGSFFYLTKLNNKQIRGGARAERGPVSSSNDFPAHSILFSQASLPKI